MLFKGFRGVIQRDPLSPPIFNVVVDAVVRNWDKEMVDITGGQGGNGQDGRHQNALNYADGSMMVLSDPGWIQGAFSTLVGLFYWVDLMTNVGKTVRMVFRPCQAAGMQSEAAYKRQMTGAGPSYRERQWVRLQCSECRVEMALGLLAVHLLIKKRKSTGGRRHWGTTTLCGEPRIYKMAFPTARGPRT